MSPKHALLLKVLVNRFHSGEGENFLKHLPQEEVKEVLGYITTSDDVSAAMRWEHDLLTRTHYSWLAPVVKGLPLYLQEPLVAAMPEKQSAGLKKLLKIEGEPRSFAPSVRTFLLDQFFGRWQPKEVVPYQYLPPSPLNSLLEFSKTEMVELIDFLALYDVSEAIRHIVDKNKLTAIYRCLSPKKQQFLRKCLHKKERIAAPKLNIDKWDGDAEKLNFLLHRRGMFRLSKALCGQSAPFLWHVVHILDTGRGGVITENYQAEAIPNITPVLRQQLLNVMDFFKQKSAA